MKKIILILAFLISIHLETNAQQENQFTTVTYFTTTVKDNTFSKNTYSSGNNGPDKDYNYYIQKSKGQRTTGWILLGTGVGLAGIGLLIGTNQNASFDQAATGGIIAAVGAVLVIISVPVMIIAGANKHKAKLMLSNQKTGFGLPPNVSKDITGITMTIPIGK